VCDVLQAHDLRDRVQYLVRCHAALYPDPYRHTESHSAKEVGFPFPARLHRKLTARLCLRKIVLCCVLGLGCFNVGSGDAKSSPSIHPLLTARAMADTHSHLEPILQLLSPQRADIHLLVRCRGGDGRVRGQRPPMLAVHRSRLQNGHMGLIRFRAETYGATERRWAGW